MSSSGMKMEKLAHVSAAMTAALVLAVAATPSALHAAVASTDVAKSGNAAPEQAVARGSDLCKLLGPDDFLAVGVKGARKPVSNSSPPTDFYCVYDGVSSYKGGIEFDAFVSETAKGATDVFKTVAQETVTREALDRAKQLGVDQAKLELKSKGDPNPVSNLAVRSGTLVFVIGLPGNPEAEAQLMALAQKVLQRSAELTR